MLPQAVEVHRRRLWLKVVGRSMRWKFSRRMLSPLPPIVHRVTANVDADV